MRAADPAIQLIAWGDSGWAGRMAEVAGEHVQYLAFHHMFDPDSPNRPVLRGELYRRDPDATWEQLMTAWQVTDAKIRGVRDSLGGRKIPLALTECHFDDSRARPLRRARHMGGRRVVRAHPQQPSAARRRAEDRHGRGFLRHTLAEQRGDDSGAEGQQPRLPPAGRPRDAALSSPHRQPCDQASGEPPDGLDVVASRRGDTVFLHVANTRRTKCGRDDSDRRGHAIRSGRVFEDRRRSPASCRI